MSALPLPEHVLARYRHDGWTPDRQRHFLEAIAEGRTVEQACRHVDLTVSSAYALRKRAAGAAFALGWRAAQLHAREALQDRMWTRALDGYTETTTRPDGSVIARHKFDNRLAMAMLTRLDRLADDSDAAGAFGRAARIAAQDFDNFLDTLAEGEPADAAGWLTAHLRADVPEPFAPVALLRTAHRYLREAEAPANDDAPDAQADAAAWAAIDAVDTADLDPAERQGWTADQWARGEAAGLVTPVDPPKAVTNPPQPPLPADAPHAGGRSGHRGGARGARGARHARAGWGRGASGDDGWSAADGWTGPDGWNAAGGRDGPPRYFTWRIAADAPDRIWYTCFPPPDGFDGLERGTWGDDAYWRSCTVAEAQAAEATLARDLEDRRQQDAARRDECFGFEIDCDAVDWSA